MKDFKATFYYKDGAITNEDTPSIEGLEVLESVPMVTIIEGIKLGLGPVANSYEINGKIEIAVVTEKLFIDYQIEPVEAEKHLQEAVARLYTVQKK